MEAFGVIAGMLTVIFGRWFSVDATRGKWYALVRKYRSDQLQGKDTKPEMRFMDAADASSYKDVETMLLYRTD